MSDRRRLLLFSALILIAVAATSVALTAYTFYVAGQDPRRAAAERAKTASADASPALLTGFDEPYVRAAWLSLGALLVTVTGGATLLIRASNPFMRRLETEAAELAKINRELDDFTYVASHDLKEPLRGISSYCQILLEDYGPKLEGDGRRRLESLGGLCQRLSQLIDDLLAYSQIGRTLPAPRPADLNQVVADVLQTMAPAIDQRNGRVVVRGRLPVASADPMVGEVFRNLIANGLKFNDSTQPIVEIGCLDDGATFYVRDNGIGIPAHHHEDVFTMFRRLHSRRKYDGTGAGLTFVRKIVEAHGGRVWLESQPGCGSTFHFTLGPGASCDRIELAASAVG